MAGKRLFFAFCTLALFEQYNITIVLSKNNLKQHKIHWMECECLLKSSVLFESAVI